MTKLLAAIAAILAAITLTACGGPPASSEMPNVVGEKLDDATETLKDIGIDVETTDASGKGRSVWVASNWTVKSQSVKAGETVSKGDTVTLTVSDSNPSTRTTKTTEVKAAPAPAAPKPATTVISLPVDRAEKNSGLTLDTYDLASNLAPSRSGERSRTVFDKANWRVVAQCDTAQGGRLTVGVVKEDEWPEVANSNVSSNTYAALLTCP